MARDSVATLIIRAGPYGLSPAAHLRARRSPFRIVGRPMSSWSENMPSGMFLKSEGYASSIADPDHAVTLARYCAEQGIPYADEGWPVPIDTFVGYGRWFQQRLVPDVEPVEVTAVTRTGDGFVTRLTSGDTCRSRAVVVAVGPIAFAHRPPELFALPPSLVSHTSDHADPAKLCEHARTVTVVGGGQSALESATLLHEAGARVRVVCRHRVSWPTPPVLDRSLSQRIRAPRAWLGTGWIPYVWARHVSVDDLVSWIGDDALARSQVVAMEARAPCPIWLVKAGCAAADLAAISVALALAHVLRVVLPGTDTNGLAAHHTYVSLLSLPVWVIALDQYHLYSARFIARRIDELERLFQATLIGAVSIALISFATKWTVTRGWLLVGFITVLMCLAVEREMVRRLFISLRRQGRMRRRVLVVGANMEGLQLCEGLLRQRSLGYEVLGFTDDALAPGETVLGRWPVVASVAQTLQAATTLGASGVLIATTAVDVETSNRLARELVAHGVHVELSSSLRDIDSVRLCVFPVGRFPMLYVQPPAHSGWRPAAKRMVDIAGATVGLLLSLPLILAAALAIKLDSPGPVFFTQERMGRNGGPFRCVQLRTMVADAEHLRAALSERNEAGSAYFKITDDPRITRVGRLLRRTSVDEVPQLWNVLHGEMSLVGPRPLPLTDVLAHPGPFVEQRALRPRRRLTVPFSSSRPHSPTPATTRQHHERSGGAAVPPRRGRRSSWPEPIAPARWVAPVPVDATHATARTPDGLPPLCRVHG